jgi:hypothetical protein
MLGIHGKRSGRTNPVLGIEGFNVRNAATFKGSFTLGKNPLGDGILATTFP